VLKFGENELLVTKRNRGKKSHPNYTSELLKLHLPWNYCSIKILGDQGLEHSSIILSSSIGPFEGKHTKNWNKYSHPWWTQSHNRFQTKTHYTWLKHPHNNTQHENLNMKYFSPLVWTLLSPHTRQIPFSYNLLGVLQRWNNILYSR
jgi:hypothetical protein